MSRFYGSPCNCNCKLYSTDLSRCQACTGNKYLTILSYLLYHLLEFCNLVFLQLLVVRNGCDLDFALSLGLRWFKWTGKNCHFSIINDLFNKANHCKYDLKVELKLPLKLQCYHQTTKILEKFRFIFSK